MNEEVDNHESLGFDLPTLRWTRSGNTEAIDLPPWVHRVRGKFFEPRTRKFYHLTDHFNEVSRESGLLYGSLVWGNKLHLEAGPEFEKSFGQLILKGVISDFEGPNNDVAEYFERILRGAPEMIDIVKDVLPRVLDAPLENIISFFEGFHEGLRESVDEKGIPVSLNDAAQIYQMLLAYWREIEAMDSVKQLHRVFVNWLGPSRAGTVKRYERICREVGLKFRNRGRPPESADDTVSLTIDDISERYGVSLGIVRDAIEKEIMPDPAEQDRYDVVKVKWQCTWYFNMRKRLDRKRELGGA